MLTATVKPELLELISQYQDRVTVKSNCFREAEMPGGGRGRSQSKGKEKQPAGMQKMATTQMGAESIRTEPATLASDSRASSAASGKRKKLALEMEQALRATVYALFQCRQQRELRD